MSAFLDFIIEYRFKILHYASLIAAVVTIHTSIQTVMNQGANGIAPNILVHTFVFFGVIGLVLLAIYFKQKDSRGHQK